MRYIDEIIVHCAETRPDQDINAATIDRWHRAQNWDCIGYHFFIKLDGTIEIGRPIEKQGAHCWQRNRTTIGICYAGGLLRTADGKKQYADTRTAAQKRSMYLLIVTLAHCFPDIIKISGHRDYANVYCPCFDAKGEYQPTIDYIRSHQFWPR